MTNVMFSILFLSLLEITILSVYDVFMRDLIGKLMILCYCMFTLLFVPLNAVFVTGLFVVVAFSCLMYVFPNQKWIVCITALFLLLSFPFSTFCMFYPVILYDAAKKKLWWLLGGTILLFTVLTYERDGMLCLFGILGIIISTFIAYQTDTLEQVEETLIRTQDDSTEKNLFLSEKNRHLIEQQNQEIYTATLKERNRIAREIHDNVGHMLSRSILMVGALKAMNQQENIDPSLVLLEDTLNQAMNNVRESVHNLHDDSIDLQASVEELVGGFTKCKCTLDFDMGRTVPNDIKYSMISIVKEALANIIKHSNATQVHIRMREHPGLYQLIIDDNGTNNGTSTKKIDFDYHTGLSAQSGMGLLNMKDRIQTLHGSIQLNTEHGFHIFITIPKGETI